MDPPVMLCELGAAGDHEMRGGDGDGCVTDNIRITNPFPPNSIRLKFQSDLLQHINTDL